MREFASVRLIGSTPLRLTYRKLRKIALAVLPRLMTRKAVIGEHLDAATRRFFIEYRKRFSNRAFWDFL